MSNYFNEHMLIEQPNETPQQLLARYEQQARAWRWRQKNEANESAATFAGDLAHALEQLTTALAASFLPPAPTARQLVAIERYVNEARLRHGVDVHPWGSYGWQVTYQDESRPGRGHDLNATWNDGERIVAIHLDVYGYGSMGVGTVDWDHSDSDEECECEACIEDARAEQAKEAAG